MLGGLLSSGVAQCTFALPGVRLINVQTGSNPNECVIKLDLYFDLDHNSGGKYIYVHIWPTALYPNFNYNNPPVTAQLINSVATIAYWHQGTAIQVLNSYSPDPGIPNFQFQNITISEGPGSAAGFDRYTIHNIEFRSSTPCNIPQSFTADAWESQSAQGQNVHCFSQGLTFIANDPTVNGLLFCQKPRTYTFGINTINPNGMNVDYKVFIDNGDGVFNKTTDIIQIASGTNISITPSTPYNSGIRTYLPYSNQQPEADRALWAVVTSPSISNEVYARIENLCIPLPVTFKSFTALRNNTDVGLKWITANESNNKGFYIERKTGNNEWQTIGFVASLAENGNSEKDIIYTFPDYNNEKSVSQYRLRQVNMDNKESYSEIKMIKGLNQQGRVFVFPNPSSDGQLNIVFEKIEGTTDIQLIDVNGRIVNQWINNSTGRIYLNNVSSGQYVIKVLIKDTNEQIAVKVFINK